MNKKYKMQNIIKFEMLFENKESLLYNTRETYLEKNETSNCKSRQGINLWSN